jgi:KaiC/GvpD/RAD55 family RecA-like ATPase
MFLQYYGMPEQPFGVTPSPHDLYLSATHREALASLFYGIKAGRGFMALIAKPGMGKTTLLFRLLERLESSARTVFLFHTQCDSREFFGHLLADLGIDPQQHSLARMHDQLHQVLLAEARAGRCFVLVIDEAQNLDDSVLETVRLLIGPAVVYLMASEWARGDEGFGCRMRLVIKSFNMSWIIVYLITLGVFGLAVDWLFMWIQRKICPWYGAQ